MIFTPTIVAQMSAFFINKESGSISVLKLMKLLYLADRLSIDLHNEPITWDRMVSMDQGPVLSRTLDYINGCKNPEQSSGWDEWIKDRDEYELGLAKTHFSREDLNYLSDADIEILETIWADFGHMNKWQIRDYTHESCSEWKNPNGSMAPIDYEDILRALGRSSDEITSFYHYIREQQKLDRILSNNG